MSLSAQPTGFIYQPFSTGSASAQKAVLEIHLNARKAYITGLRESFIQKGTTASGKQYKQALFSNFATVLIDTESSSGPSRAEMFNGASEGNAANSSTHGERQAWQGVQTWYTKTPKRTGQKTIISDRSPCENRVPPCIKYFGENGEATKRSPSNPLPFEPSKDCFIYAVKEPNNDALLSELLKADPDFYVLALTDLLKFGGSDVVYIKKQLTLIAEKEPGFYASLIPRFKEKGVDISEFQDLKGTIEQVEQLHISSAGASTAAPSVREASSSVPGAGSSAVASGGDKAAVSSSSIATSSSSALGATVAAMAEGQSTPAPALPVTNISSHVLSTPSTTKPDSGVPAVGSTAVAGKDSDKKDKAEEPARTRSQTVGSPGTAGRGQPMLIDYRNKQRRSRGQQGKRVIKEPSQVSPQPKTPSDEDKKFKKK